MKTKVAVVTLAACLAQLHAQTRFHVPQVQTPPRPNNVAPPKPGRRESPAVQAPVSGSGLRQPFNGAQPGNRSNLGANRGDTAVVRPPVVTPVMRRSMTYNTRPGGVHITPEYFSTHYGRTHGFHFPNYPGGPCIGDCGFRVYNAEWYFNYNGAWFGIIGPLPGDWRFQTDYLYIDMANDGNYYLYDAQFPGVTVQIVYVENIGDDQVDTD